MLRRTLIKYQGLLEALGSKNLPTVKVCSQELRLCALRRLRGESKGSGSLASILSPGGVISPEAIESLFEYLFETSFTYH